MTGIGSWAASCGVWLVCSCVSGAIGADIVATFEVFVMYSYSWCPNGKRVQQVSQLGSWESFWAGVGASWLGGLARRAIEAIGLGVADVT